MRRPPAIALLVVLSVLPGPLVAQQPTQTGTSPSRDPQAISFLQNALGAMGSQNATSIQDTLVMATTTPPADRGGSPVSVTIKTKGMNKIRADSASGGNNASVIYNKGREIHSSSNGWRTANSANAEHKRIEHLPALLLAYELARSDFSTAYVGQEALNGRSVQHLSLTRVSAIGTGVDDILTKNSRLDLFIDAQTFLIAKISFPYMATNDWRRGYPMEIFYDDYRNVNGLLVPFHQRYVYDGQPAGDMQFTSVAINQGLQDSDFEGRQ
jgi:hypothetical protein